jgi:hypothetical protein
MEKVIDTYYLVKIGNGWYKQVRIPILDDLKTAVITDDYKRATKLSRKPARTLANDWGGKVVTMRTTSEDN